MSVVKLPNIKLINELLAESASSLNKGWDLFATLSNKCFELTEANTYGNEDQVSEMPLLEAKLFTFFKRPDGFVFDSTRKMVNFILRMILIEAAIVNHFEQDGSCSGIIENIILDKNFHNIDIQDKEKYVIFQSAEDNYNLTVIVYKETGYREGKINGQYLFTRSGPLVITDLFTLITVMNGDMRITDDLIINGEVDVGEGEPVLSLDDPDYIEEAELEKEIAEEEEYYEDEDE